jgi:type IV secretion system protein TrbL
MKRGVVILTLLLLVVALPVHAELTSVNPVDQLFQQFRSASASWQGVILQEAQFIFWCLAFIGLGFTLTISAIRGPTLAGFALALVQWLIFTGIALWAMQGGPAFTHAIIQSFYQMAGNASGQGDDLKPTVFIDMSLGLYQKVTQQQNIVHLAESICAELTALGILACSCWVTCNLIKALCASWIFASVGTIFLSFGALGLTRDIAFNFYRSTLGIAAKIMVMVLIMGMGLAFLKSTLAAMSPQPKSGELFIYLAATLVLAVLSQSLPDMVAGVFGVHGHSAIGNWGIGTAWMVGSFLGSGVLRGLQKADKAMDGSLSSVEKAANAAETYLANGGAKNGRRNGNRGVRP